MENTLTLKQKLELITKIIDGVSNEEEKQVYNRITSIEEYKYKTTLMNVYGLDDVQKTNLKMITKIVSGNASKEEEKQFSYKFFKSQTFEMTKDIKKMTIEQSVNKKLKDNEGGVFLKDGMEVEYMEMLNRYTASKILKERERSNKFLHNKKEAEKYAFVDELEYKKLGKKMPKQNVKQVEEWTSKAYPNIDIQKWEKELVSVMLKNVIS